MTIFGEQVWGKGGGAYGDFQVSGWLKNGKFEIHKIYPGSTLLYKANYKEGVLEGTGEHIVGAKGSWPFSMTSTLDIHELQAFY